MKSETIAGARAIGRHGVATNHYVCIRCGIVKPLGGNTKGRPDRTCEDCRPYVRDRTTKMFAARLDQRPCRWPCDKAHHDHLDDAGEPLDCETCFEPAHFDYRAKEYRHDDPDIDRYGDGHLIA